MDRFYEELVKALREQTGEVWTEVQLDGEDAGKKTLHVCQPAFTEEETKTNRYVERVGGSQKLVICGAGHVSIPIIRMGNMLGFHVTVIDDRPKFADHARAAQASEVLCEPFHEALEKIPGDTNTWFVIVTRGHRYDTECLKAIIRKPHAYVGMMGSKRRVALVKQQLEESGVERALLDSIHTPIGLSISAQTPEEIAVSVMAEIIQVKNADSRAGTYSRDMLRELEEYKGKMVMATIVSRKGSAPRGVGTKMLIREDGMTVDTIGGGCIEGDVIQKALLMMRTDQPAFQVCRVDMTADAAEDEGMVCGGVVQVMLDRTDI